MTYTTPGCVRFNTEATAAAVAAQMTAEDAGQPYGGTYTVEPFGAYFVVVAFDDEGHRLGPV